VCAAAGAVACWLQENLNTELAERDWGVQQVLTSANWGGVVGNFFTGGLNLQVGTNAGGHRAALLSVLCWVESVMGFSRTAPAPAKV
jgi:hypothetical protein